jgi:hypothetical protein
MDVDILHFCFFSLAFCFLCHFSLLVGVHSLFLLSTCSSFTYTLCKQRNTLIILISFPPLSLSTPFPLRIGYGFILWELRV